MAKREVTVEDDMAELNQQQFQDSYAPDPKLPRTGSTRFVCESCGSRYVSPVTLGPEVKKITSCRNRGCPGPVVRQ